MYDVVKNKRVPNSEIYNFVFTIIIIFAIMWLIKMIIPTSRYNLYFTN